MLCSLHFLACLRHEAIKNTTRIDTSCYANRREKTCRGFRCFLFYFAGSLFCVEASTLLYFKLDVLFYFVLLVYRFIDMIRYNNMCIFHTQILFFCDIRQLHLSLYFNICKCMSHKCKSIIMMKNLHTVLYWWYMRPLLSNGRRCMTCRAREMR